MNKEQETNADDFQSNQDQIIADAAKNIVDEQGQLFPLNKTETAATHEPQVTIADEHQINALPPEFQQPIITAQFDNIEEPPRQAIEIQENNPNSPNKKKTFKLPKTKRNMLLALAGLVIFSGLLAGLVLTANAVFNKPQTVVAKSIMNTTKSDYFNAVKTNINVTNSNGTSVSFYALGGQKDSLTRADFNLRYAVFNIDGSFLYENKAEVSYFKVNGLSDLAKSFGAPISDTQNYDSWVKLSKQDIQPATQSVGLKQQNGDINPMACVQSMSKYIQTDEFKTKLTEAYGNNQFADIKKVGNEKVDNQKTGKYQVTVNSDTFELFATDLNNNALKPKMAAVDPSCNMDSGDTTLASDSKMQIKNVFVWVNSKKQLLQIAGEVTNGSSTASIQLNLVNDKKLDYSVPTSSVDSIQKLFGI